MIYEDTESNWDSSYIFKKTLTSGKVLRLNLTIYVTYTQKPLGQKADNEQDCYGYVDYTVNPLQASIDWCNLEYPETVFAILEQEIHQEITKYFLKSA